MFTLNDDLSIYVTRGDAVFFSVTADDNGKPYVFQAGDIVRIKVYGKKDAENVVLQKDFPVMAATESVDIYLTEDDTKIDDVISKHKDYWYEVELNPFTNPTTIIGYDEDGAKVFRLFPEGDDIPPRQPVKPEDIPIVDDKLDMTSTRPVENQAIARAIVAMQAELDETQMKFAEKVADTNADVADVAADVVVERARVDNLVSGSTADGAEVLDIRVGADGVTYGSAGTAVREQAGRALNLSSRLSLYDINVVGEYMGLRDIGGVDSLVGVVTDSTKTWQYVSKTIRLPVGKYTAVIRDMGLSSVGSFSIKGTPTALYFLQNVTEPGVYVFDVFDDGKNYTEDGVTLLLQLSTATPVPNGAYYISGLSIYEGDITDRVAFPEHITGVDGKLNRQIGKNLFDKSKVTEGVFIGGSGTELTNEYSHAFYASDYIAVLPKTKYALTDYNIGGAYVAFYNEYHECIASISGTTEDGGDRLLDLGGIITTPAECAYVRISGNIANIGINQLEMGDSITEYEEYTEYAPMYENTKRIKKLEDTLGNLGVTNTEVYAPEKATASRMNNGDRLSVATPNAKNYNAIGFNANVTDFKKIIISHGKTNPYCSAYIVVDGSSVSVYKYTTAASLVATYNHGLDIADFISVNVRIDGGFAATVTIVTASGVFTQSVEWNGSNGDIMVESDGSVLTACTLTYYIHGLNKDIWMFGDSYFDYWCKTAIDWGVDNYYLDGFSGRNVADAVASLQKCLAYRKPKKVVWFMGMNNADNGEVNAAWLSAYNSLVGICDSKGVELILSTVPNVPDRDHTYKNQIVKSSGYRYIDICGAVGADVSANWFDGLLAGDNVHPSAIGAAAIANFIISQLPEVLE